MIPNASVGQEGEQSTSVREALTYRGGALRAVTLPLGGIGTGSVALAGDGGLRQWQIVNNVNHDAHVPDSIFGIWAGGWGAAGRNAVVLQSDALYDDGALQPSLAVSDRLGEHAATAEVEQVSGCLRLCFTRSIAVSANEALPVTLT